MSGKREAEGGSRIGGQREAEGGPRISTAGSRVSAWVIPTNEEQMIALHTVATLKAPAPTKEFEHA